MSNHSLEYYAGIINFFLYKRVDDTGKILHDLKQPGLQTFPLLDVQALERVKNFGPLSIVKILQLIGRYYAKYHTTPSKVVYEDLILNDPEFRLWYTDKATELQRSEVQRVEVHLFQPVEDERYYKERITDLAVQVQIKVIIEDTSKKLSEGVGRGLQALEQLYASTFAYREKYQQAEAEVTGEFTYLYSGEKNAEDYQHIAGVKTQFDLIELRPNGLFGLFGGPKDGKTRIAIAVARYLASMGYDVEYLDLENGVREVEARFLQAELTDWKGYPVSMNFFYSGIFIHEDRIPASITKYHHIEATQLSKGDTVYIIQTWTEIEENKDGTEREKMNIELSLFESLVQGPTADPLEDTEENNTGFEWEYLGAWEEDLELTDGQPVVEDFGIVLNQALAEIREDKVGVGEVRIDYLPAGDISEVGKTLTNIMEDPKTDFFSRPKWRVLIVDWMQLLQNKKLQEIWKRTRENYGTLKSWQARYQMYVMVVDGVKDTSQLKKLYPNLEATGTVGTSQTDFNVASSVLFCVSDDEKKSRTARLVAKATRYGASGSNVQECLTIDEEYSTIRVMSTDDHKEANPELWKEKPGKKGGQKKETNVFDDVALDD